MLLLQNSYLSNVGEMLVILGKLIGICASITLGELSATIRTLFGSTELIYQRELV